MQQRLAALRCFFVQSVVSVLTGLSVQKPSGHCAGSGPLTAAFACSSSLVLWVDAFLDHLGETRERDIGVIPRISANLNGWIQTNNLPDH